MMDNDRYALITDARGLRCPLPVLRAAKALRGLPKGAEMALLADDPMAVIDVPHFCAEAGHGLVHSQAEAAHHIFVIKAYGA